MDLNDLKKDILCECAHDDVGLWSILRTISANLYFAEKLPEWVQPKALQIIRDLVDEGLIEAGNPNGPTFRAISPITDETLAFIVREWDALGRTPNLGDVCWFRATLKGKQLSDDLGLEW